jgi:hypothetical protein
MTYKEAGQVAHGLIQGYIGPDHRVMDMQSFYGALVQALQSVHQHGWTDRGSEDSAWPILNSTFFGTPYANMSTLSPSTLVLARP